MVDIMENNKVNILTGALKKGLPLSVALSAAELTQEQYDQNPALQIQAKKAQADFWRVCLEKIMKIAEKTHDANIILYMLSLHTPELFVQSETSPASFPEKIQHIIEGIADARKKLDI